MKLHLEKPWPAVVPKLMEHDTSLTEDDLHYTEGEDDELLNRLAKKMNRSPEQVKDWIESMSHNK